MQKKEGVIHPQEKLAECNLEPQNVMGKITFRTSVLEYLYNIINAYMIERGLQ